MKLTLAEIERKARQFSRRYGAGLGWSDAQINQALADHGYPDLTAMPDRDTSTEARQHAMYGAGWSLAGPIGRPDSPIERHRWRRVNAMHLIGHVIAEHPVPRCDACSDWFPLTEREVARGQR